VHQSGANTNVCVALTPHPRPRGYCMASTNFGKDGIFPHQKAHVGVGLVVSPLANARASPFYHQLVRVFGQTRVVKTMMPTEHELADEVPNCVWEPVF
jgi:hypothetical protein